jgi:putative copper export protein
VLALLAQSTAVAPDLALPQATWATLTGTRYGEVWVWRMLGLLVVSAAVGLGLWGPERRSHAALTLATLVGLFVPLTFSLLSHAAAQPEGAPAAIVADALHLVAAAIWGGGVVLLAVVLLPALRPFSNGAWRDVLRVAIPRFSVLAVGAWGILLLSGLYAAWLQVGSLPGLTETPYGRTLLLKGALLLLILILAAWHFWQGKDLARSRFPRLSATLALEALLVIAVLLVVGRLIGQPPAREVLVSRTPTQLDVPLTFPTNDGERAATLTISPGAAGSNTFTLEVAGDPLPEKTEGVLRVNLPAQDLGEQELRLPQTAPNTFSADGTELAVTGDWQLTAILRQIGAFSWTAQSALHIGTTPPAPPVVNPPPRFGGLGIVGMLVAAAGCLALAFGIASDRRTRRPQAIPGGVVLLVAGAALLLAGRLPVASAPDVAEPPIALISTPAGTPTTMPDHMHEHDMTHAATPEAEILPGIATPTSAGDITVTLDADTRSAAPTDLTLTVTDAGGAPVTGARVVVFPEMAGMGPSESLTAEEQAPGTYVVTDAPLTMPGSWEIAARISPKGQPSSTVRFATEVGSN